MEKEPSNDLRYTTSEIIGEEHIYVNIRLNDECKNGHQDFSITGDIYQAGKPKADRYHLSGGCIHEDILRHFPKFKIFINLHLCDWEGIPMYAVENGFYHLKSGFNRTKPSEKDFKDEFCQYYRITPEQFDVLNASENKTQYAINLQKIGVLVQWKAEATKAIELLEELSGQKFLMDSKKSQFHAPTLEELQDNEQKIKDGYYTEEAVAQRAIDAHNKRIQDVKDDAQKEIKKIERERDIKVYILSKGLDIDNFIYYNHSNEGVFNWSDATYYKSITKEQFDQFIINTDLPDVTFKFGKAK